MPVRAYKGLEWKYDDELYACVTKEAEIHVF